MARLTVSVLSTICSHRTKSTAYKWNLVCRICKQVASSEFERLANNYVDRSVGQVAGGAAQLAGLPCCDGWRQIRQVCRRGQTGRWAGQSPHCNEIHASVLSGLFNISLLFSNKHDKISRSDLLRSAWEDLTNKWEVLSGRSSVGQPARPELSAHSLATLTQ